jgi:hypothetical protein
MSPKVDWTTSINELTSFTKHPMESIITLPVDALKVFLEKYGANINLVKMSYDGLTNNLFKSQLDNPTAQIARNSEESSGVKLETCKQSQLLETGWFSNLPQPTSSRKRIITTAVTGGIEKLNLFMDYFEGQLGKHELLANLIILESRIQDKCEFLKEDLTEIKKILIPKDSEGNPIWKYENYKGTPLISPVDRPQNIIVFNKTVYGEEGTDWGLQLMEVEKTKCKREIDKKGDL